MRLSLPSSEQILFMTNVLVAKLFAKKFQQKTPIRTILVVKWDEIGDMATATHVFECLKLSHPNSKLTLLCKPFVKALIEHDPHIDSCITDIKDWNQTYDAVIELRGTWTTFFKSLKYRPKYRVSRAELRWQNRGQQLHEIDTNFEVIKPLLITSVNSILPKLYFSPSDKSFVDQFLLQNGIQGYCLIHAGARRKLRQWNPDRFAKAATYLFQRHGLHPLFIGSKEENTDTEQIRSMMDISSLNVCGQFSLSQLSCLASGASFYLGNESGPLHIASAFSIPTLALFGPGVPNVFYPRQSKARVLHHVLPCNPCDQIHCVQPSNPCISMIQLADVLINMDEILQS